MDRLWSWLAGLLPKRLIYFSTIRVAVYGTTGKYSKQVVPDLSIMDALKRWSS